MKNNEVWRKTVKDGFCDCKTPEISAGYVPPDYIKLLITCSNCNKRMKGSRI
ncbi:hypothetical protein LCGC14_1748090 [marine sediment metagenome]|uniref:Uncharacterized protein n=1 Tax=marine sediment metagenome TaxID=412755 RepID=A0A0F9JJV8_9ZZZZ